MNKTFKLSITGGYIACGIAAGISYAINKSILWAILHLFLGWIYIGYILALWIMK